MFRLLELTNMTNKWTHSGNIIITGFVCSAILMGLLVYGCFLQNTEMVSVDYYEKELQFQEHIDAQNNTTGFDKQIILATTKDSLVLDLPTAISTDMTQATAYFYCAADSKQDKTILLPQRSDGHYGINTKQWRRMRYKVAINFVHQQKKYSKDFLIQLK